MLAATPQYLAEHGRPEHPQDLRKHACLVQVSDPIWSFDNGKESISIKPHSRFTSNTYTVLCRAALGGLGIAVLPSHLALPHVLAGQLELVLEKFSLEDRPLYAAFTPGVTPPQKVRSLIAFLSDWFVRHPSQAGPERQSSLASQSCSGLLSTCDHQPIGQAAAAASSRG